MRSALLVAAFLLPVAACSDAVVPTATVWMDWPAEVRAEQPFRVRMVVFYPCAARDFRVGRSVGASNVTLAPYFLEQRDDVFCIAASAPSPSITAGNLDTAAIAPGFEAAAPRTIDLRTFATGISVVPAVVGHERPLTIFGTFTVRPASDPAPLLVRRNAGGNVTVEVDTSGCTRVRPAGLYLPGSAMVLDSAVDTVGLSGRFVRGYIYDAPAPICGETRVFHLGSVN